MNIVMVTNSYAPVINGVARSVDSFTQEYRRRGHRVLVIAPRSNDAPPTEIDTIRWPAIQNFTGTDFAVSVPLAGDYLAELDAFRPDIVHSHHPFLLGAVAVRIATRYAVPLVFTHHTMYEHYTHYVPGASHALRHFVKELTIGYCHLVDAVIAPSRSVAGILQSRGVDKLTAVVPTGLDVNHFRNGDGSTARCQWNIPPDGIVVGYVGRLAPEKNLKFLTDCIRVFLKNEPHAHFLVVGDGSERQEMVQAVTAAGVSSRVHFTGILDGTDLANTYAAMDVFAFTSRTETQGIVLAEAMAAGLPVVALDAPGVREVVRDGENGRLLATQSRRLFVVALRHVATASAEQKSRYRVAAHATAERFSITESADLTLALYRQLLATSPRARELETSGWEMTRRKIDTETRLLVNRMRAAGAMLTEGRHPSRVPGLRHIVAVWRRFRRWLSRREWSVRLLNLPVSVGTSDESGLVILQIDGLSRLQLERALEHGRMPFLRKLLTRESYRVETMYSGLPATTPAVLGELFYGVQQAVPAFGFLDHRSGQVVEMYQPGIAAQLQAELAQQGEGLIEGGSVYCVPYSGGGVDSSFCPATTGWRNLEEAALWQRLALVLMNVMSLIRMLAMSAVELGMAIADCVRGIRRRREILQEVLYVPRRLLVNVGLREAVAIGAEADVTRGVPILHVNFLGYDENAHRRGPESLFAHYALRGIDRALRRIWNAAHASHRRNYHVWVISDHGQERTVPYSRELGQTIDEAVKKMYRTIPSRQNTPQKVPSADRTIDAPGPVTVAIGPLGYIYWPDSLNADETAEIAQRLTNEAHVPMVIAAVNETVRAWTPQGCFTLPDQAAEFLGSPALLVMR